MLAVCQNTHVSHGMSRQYRADAYGSLRITQVRSACISPPSPKMEENSAISSTGISLALLGCRWSSRDALHALAVPRRDSRKCYTTRALILNMPLHAGRGRSRRGPELLPRWDRLHATALAGSRMRWKNGFNSFAHSQRNWFFQLRVGLFLKVRNKISGAPEEVG